MYKSEGMPFTLMRWATNSRNAALVFSCLIFLVYGLGAELIRLFRNESPRFNELAWMATISSLCVFLGSKVPFLDFRFSLNASRTQIPVSVVHIVIWFGFIVFATYSFATASAIPLLSSFKGATAAELSLQRGELFKAREGGQVILLYFSTLYSGSALPYSIVRLYSDKFRYRNGLAAVFTLYTISALHKALFVNVLLPVFYEVVQRNRVYKRSLLAILLIGFLLAFGTTALSSGAGAGQGDHATGDTGRYFSADYSPSGVLDRLVWRATAVPIFTAVDSLTVFDEQFGGQYFFGKTSSMLAFFVGQDKVEFEKIVFGYQWGWNAIANANSVFFVEAYVNFGWVGVVFFSIFVGQSLRWMSLSADIGIKALWVIYCAALFSGGLIGMLFSNGYIIIFILTLFCSIVGRPQPDRRFFPPTRYKPYPKRNAWSYK